MKNVIIIVLVLLFAFKYTAAQKSNPHNDIPFGETSEAEKEAFKEAYRSYNSSESTAREAMGSQPLFIGDKVPADFGSSRYDKYISGQRVLEGNLERIRAERRAAHHKEIAYSVLIGLGILTFVVVLIKTAKPKKDENTK